jgi:hypothetical protein
MATTASPTLTSLEESSRTHKITAPQAWTIAAGFGLISSLWSLELFYNALGLHNRALAFAATPVVLAQLVASFLLSRGSKSGRAVTIALAALVGVSHAWYIATTHVHTAADSFHNSVPAALIVLVPSVLWLLAPYISLVAAFRSSCVKYCTKR